jgi:hypothetical protein
MDIVKVGEARKARRIFVGKSLRKHPLRRLKTRWVDKIKIDLMEICCKVGISGFEN